MQWLVWGIAALVLLSACVLKYARSRGSHVARYDHLYKMAGVILVALVHVTLMRYLPSERYTTVGWMLNWLIYSGACLYQAVWGVQAIIRGLREGAVRAKYRDNYYWVALGGMALILCSGVLFCLQGSQWCFSQYVKTAASDAKIVYRLERRDLQRDYGYMVYAEVGSSITYIHDNGMLKEVTLRRVPVRKTVYLHDVGISPKLQQSWTAIRGDDLTAPEMVTYQPI